MDHTNTTRQYVDIALFGAAGGALEAVLGTITHWFRFIPFAGLIPTAALIGVLTAFYIFSRSTRDVMYCGIVVAFLKMLSPGGIVLIAVFSVLVETVLFCVIIKLVPGPTSLRLIVTGASISLWPIVHKIIKLIVFLGIAAPEAIDDILSKLTLFFESFHLSTGVIIGLVPVIHMGVGITAAMVGKTIGTRLKAHRDRS